MATPLTTTYAAVTSGSYTGRTRASLFTFQQGFNYQGTPAPTGNPYSTTNTYIFDLSDGDWVAAQIYIALQFNQPANPAHPSDTLTFTTTIVPNGSGSTITSTQTFTIPYGASLGTGSLLAFSDDTTGTNTVLIQGYKVLSYLNSGATATVIATCTCPISGTATQVQQPGSATLYSILPTAPAFTVSATDTTGSPSPGTGAATLSPPGTNDPATNNANGFAPFTYAWSVGTNPRGVAPDSMSGGTTSNVTWVYNTDPGDVYASCTLTNAPYPHEVGSPLSNNVGHGVSRISPAPTNAITSFFLNTDGPRRPLAAKADALSSSMALGYCSNDAGHTFLSSTIDSDPTCTDISLLVDRHSNRFAAIYSKGAAGSTSIYSAFGPITDTFTPDNPPATISGIAGAYPIAAQHPTDRLFCLMAYLSGGTLSVAESGDLGQNWATQGTIASGQDFSSSGRVGLTWLQEAAFAAWASGNNIETSLSVDRGVNWSAPVAAATAGPYSGLSLLGWQGTLYLLAFAGSPAVPVLLISETLGTAWTPSTGVLPSGLSAPSCIGVLSESSMLRLGLTNNSLDDGQTWPAN